ncbi:Flp pilus assembly complex ATPase component TadA [Candidatus Woesearchaeota archaeon]|nr:Flp pilus assembly complex ATPase component TadA [Candidatus Woesearchaeota archaeon]
MEKVVIEKLVPDTSVIIEAIITQKINKKELEIKELILHEAVFAELEHQANQGKATGYVGIDELKEIREMAQNNMFSLRIIGQRPTGAEIRYAKIGEIDALIRQLAWDEDATLMTADKVQARIGEARGVKTCFIPLESKARTIALEKYFDETTMSVHLREGVAAKAKKGKPGAWDFVNISKKKLTAETIKEISREIIEEARIRTDGFLEIERQGSTIIQLGLYRIVVTRPPFSDGWEITAVKPVKQLNLMDYKLGDKLTARIAGQAEGILIAGAPGHGKTTFAQALSIYFAEQGKIVKTVEAPRDLILPEEITQLAISRGSPEEIHDVLLLSRPDYTVFDEMRNTKDFLLYSDLRLAGVGMVGVIHGTNPIDAIQRFIGKLDLGVIPHVIDTVVFIKNGEIGQVLSVKMAVKVPSGMTEADLARPVITIDDFETGKALAEIYSYGEETVVVPVSEVKERQTGAKKLAANAIERAFQRYTDYIKVELPSDEKAIVHVPEERIAGIIGREGKNIRQLEEQLGIGLDIRALGEEEQQKPEGNEITYDLEESSKYFEFFLDKKMQGKDADLYIGDDYLATFNVGKKSTIRIKKQNPLGKSISNARKYGERIRILV